MTVDQHFHFVRDDVFPSWFANAIQSFLTGTATTLRLSRQNSTTVQIVPAEPAGIAAVAIQGRWRWVETTITRAHPGGGAGTYDVWAVALDNDVDDSPDPHTDHTDPAFTLRITATGVPPSGAGVEIYEKIGEVDWSAGGAITALRQTMGKVPGALLDTGAVAGSGGVSVTRQPDGSVLLDLPDGSVGASEIAGSLKPSGTAAAATEALRALGTTASTATAGNDGRLSNSRAPNGSAGGSLSGSYPNPAIATAAVSAAMLAASAADSSLGKVVLAWLFATPGPAGQTVLNDPADWQTLCSISSVPAGVYLALPRFSHRPSSNVQANSPYNGGQARVTHTGTFIGLGETRAFGWSYPDGGGLGVGAETPLSLPRVLWLTSTGTVSLQARCTGNSQTVVPVGAANLDLIRFT